MTGIEIQKRLNAAYEVLRKEHDLPEHMLTEFLNDRFQIDTKVAFLEIGTTIIIDIKEVPIDPTNSALVELIRGRLITRLYNIQTLVDEQIKKLGGKNA